jgi:hypothetical protein
MSRKSGNRFSDKDMRHSPSLQRVDPTERDVLQTRTHKFGPLNIKKHIAEGSTDRIALLTLRNGQGTQTTSSFTA